MSNPFYTISAGDNVEAKAFSDRVELTDGGNRFCFTTEQIKAFDDLKAIDKDMGLVYAYLKLTKPYRVQFKTQDGNIEFCGDRRYAKNSLGEMVCLSLTASYVLDALFRNLTFTSYY